MSATAPRSLSGPPRAERGPRRRAARSEGCVRARGARLQRHARAHALGRARDVQRHDVLVDGHQHAAEHVRRALPARQQRHQLREEAGPALGEVHLAVYGRVRVGGGGRARRRARSRRCHSGVAADSGRAQRAEPSRHACTVAWCARAAPGLPQQQCPVCRACRRPPASLVT